tara:strand:- start:621 stop:1364 length:744 start_codon:yes stop_codon:yes gene_type:complete
MADKTCLVPISVSSLSFRTDSFTSALRAINREYDTVVFFIADTLQIYNKALQASSGKEVASTVGMFRQRKSYLSERRRWLQRLHRELGPCPLETAEWQTIGVDDIASAELFDLFRATAILFSVEEGLFLRVMSDAESHVVASKQKGTNDSRRRLSVLYLIDEIAMNIYLHCVRGIGDEYYIDGVLPSMASLYDGSLGVTAKELVASIGLTPCCNAFDFMRYDHVASAWRASSQWSSTQSLATTQLRS